jgi:hypothetical protein
MPLWSNVNFSSGNTKPRMGFPAYFASGNVDAGANGADMIAVTASAYANANGSFFGRGGPGHAGWINMKVGRGWVADLIVANTGNNITNLSYATVLGGNGSLANVQVIEVNGSGSVGNVVRVRVNVRGQDYNSAPTITVANAATTGYPARFTPVMGGRAGRIQGEVIVAMGSLSGAPNPANNWFGL